MAKTNPDVLIVGLNEAGQITLKTRFPALPIDTSFPLCHPGVGTLADAHPEPSKATSVRTATLLVERGSVPPVTKRASAVGPSVEDAA